MGYQFLHTILTYDDPVNIFQRTFQPAPQEACPHSGMGIIQNIQQCAFSSAIAHVSGNFQITQGFFAQSQGIILAKRHNRMEGSGRCLHDFFQIAKESPVSCGYGLAAGLLNLFRDNGPDIPFPAAGQQTTAQTGGYVVFHGPTECIRYIQHRFCRRIHRQHIKEIPLLFPAVPKPPPALASRHIGHGRCQITAFFMDINQVIIGLIRNGILIENRSRCDDLNNPALNQPSGRLRIFQLFAYCHTVPLLYEPVDVIFGRVIRNAAHGGPLFFPCVLTGQSQFQFMRCRNGIIIKHFIEISQPEKQDGILISSLYLLILIH